MNSFQSRKGTRPVCRMSSRELLEGGITQGTEAGDLSPTGPLFKKENLCSREDFPFLFCAAVLSCPCILQVHSAETHPRALHSEHIKAPASPCACVSQQCQPCPRSEVNFSRAIAQPPSSALACQPLKGALKHHWMRYFYSKAKIQCSLYSLVFAIFCLQNRVLERVHLTCSEQFL